MTATVYRTAGTMFEATKGCSRRSLLAHLGLASVFLTSGSGCTSLWGRSDQSGDSDAALQKLLKVPDPPDLIGTAAVPSGLKFVRVEGVGVVNDLPSTGGPAQPSGYRDQLLEEMKRRDVVNPNQYLERDDTALVRVNALIPPGARRGDRIDVTLSAPVKTEATNLHGGWLLDTRLRHQQSLGGAVRSSDVMAIAMGSVLTRFDHEGRQDLVTRIEGKLLSGGIVQTDRRLGLILRPEFQHVKMASAIAAAINRRFYFFDGTTRRGIAKAVEDDFIEIDVHPRYRGNEFRMMETLRGLGVAPESAGTQARLVELGKQLRDVSTAADAAIKLEGMGENAIPTLIDATTQSNPELKFYAAEALAYLDRAEAVKPLIECLRDDPAFRQPALEALRGLKHHDVKPALAGLFADASLEIRYGAFDALRRRETPSDAARDDRPFELFELTAEGSPAIVASLRNRAEIVVFGNASPLNIQTVFRGPAGWMIRETQTPGKVRLTRFRTGADDVRIEIDNTVGGLLGGMVQAGGSYGDAIAMLRMAKTSDVLVDPLAFDPLPEGQRKYLRDDEATDVD